MPLPHPLQIGAVTEPTVPLCSIPSIRFGAGFLARTFARLVKDLVDTAQAVCDIKTLQVNSYLLLDHTHMTITTNQVPLLSFNSHQFFQLHSNVASFPGLLHFQFLIASRVTKLLHNVVV